MSDTIENPKGGLVLKVANFKFFYVVDFKIKIPDFDLNEFLSERLKKDSKFSSRSFLRIYLRNFESIEKFLIHYYNLYKKNLKIIINWLKMNKK